MNKLNFFRRSSIHKGGETETSDTEWVIGILMGSFGANGLRRRAGVNVDSRHLISEIKSRTNGDLTRFKSALRKLQKDESALDDLLQRMNDAHVKVGAKTLDNERLKETLFQVQTEMKKAIIFRLQEILGMIEPVN